MVNKVRPSTNKASFHLFGRYVMSALLHAMGHALDRQIRATQPQEHHFDHIPRRLQMLNAFQFPLNVDSNAKEDLSLASRSNSISRNLPALRAANSGCKGDRPAAIRSAFTKRRIPVSAVKNFLAKVVFPAPLGPAIMMHLGLALRRAMLGHALAFLPLDAFWSPSISFTAAITATSSKPHSA